MVTPLLAASAAVRWILRPDGGLSRARARVRELRNASLEQSSFTTLRYGRSGARAAHPSHTLATGRTHISRAGCCTALVGRRGRRGGRCRRSPRRRMRWCTKTNEVLGGRARGTTVEAAAARLQVGALAQAADRRAHLRGLRSVHRVRAAREHLFARLALPDPHRRPLHGVLPAEEAREARVLRDLDLLHLLAERRAVPDTVLAGDPDLLCPLLRLRGAGAGGSAGCRESGAASRARAVSSALELRRATRRV